MRLEAVARRTILLGIAVLLGLPGQVAAQTFSPVRPAICPSASFWVVPFRSKEFPSFGNGNYKDHMSYSREFIANGWTTQRTLRKVSFDTELNFDLLRLGTLNNPNQNVLSGTLTSNPTIIATSSLQGDPGFFRWDTDSTVVKSGFEFDGISLCSSSSASLDTTISYVVGPRVNGVLANTNDVVYLKTGNLPGVDHLGVVLRAVNSAPGADFDLYARCGSVPTPTAYDYRAFSSDSFEFLDITCVSSTIYIAIHAFNSGGPFALNLDFHMGADRSGDRKRREIDQFG